MNLTLIRDFETSKLKDDPKLKSFLDDAENIIKQCAFVPTVREAPPACRLLLRNLSKSNRLLYIPLLIIPFLIAVDKLHQG